MPNSNPVRRLRQSKIWQQDKICPDCGKPLFLTPLEHRDWCKECWEYKDKR